MLLIDRVEELEAGKRAVAIRNVTAHEQVFNGHFPGNPVLPGGVDCGSNGPNGSRSPLINGWV